MPFRDFLTLCLSKVDENSTVYIIYPLNTTTRLQLTFIYLKARHQYLASYKLLPDCTFH